MPCIISSVNYTNNSSRLQVPVGQDQNVASSPETVLSLESGKRGLCLRVRKTSTAARRKIGAFKLAVIAFAAAATMQHASAQILTTIQPLTESTSKDAKIYVNTPTMNFQSNLDVYATATGSIDFSSLVQFSLATVPAGTVTNATLTLYCRSLGPSSGTASGGTVSIRPITSSWSETTADAAVTGAPPLATYNAVFGANPTITLGNVVATQNVTGAGFITWDITNLVQQWQTGALANNGLYFFTNTPNGDVGFDDVDTATVAGSSPKLSVTVVPEPGTNVALALAGIAVAGGVVCRQRKVATI